MLRVLVVDDQSHVLDALELLFEMQGDLPVVRASSPEQAVEALRAGGIGVVVQDMNFGAGTTSGDEGVALFGRLRALDPEVPVVLMTAWASLGQAVALVKQGADDYLQKPWDDARLLKKVKALMAAREQGLASRRGSGGRGAPDLCGLLSRSARMQAVVSLAIKVAAADVPVLVTGPNGAGKEKLAEIVQANSARREGPFVRVNVGALPDELFAAEIFGAEAGAFTGARARREGRFEAADGGTLFLDEIGNLSLESQAKLLRALQTGEFERLGSSVTRRADVRIVAATNIDMASSIAAGRFREDLYYRLAVIELEVPPLEERVEDIVPLAEAFVAQHAERPVRLSEAGIAALEHHRWPGNVRELQNRIRRALLVAEGPKLEPEHLGLELAAPGAEDEPSLGSEGEADEPGISTLEQAERDAIEQALVIHGYVISRAAAALGLSRQALYRRMRRLGVAVRRDLDG
ncbi:MAG: sigma-54-dependent Fis family transcriptional regulator [Myxococcales bacterium]|nr:sigma-54-dependent Fis family transcriptional regulator [Myxococcales bacterium]